ncbi:PREDICTED: phosphatidylinositol 4-kinase beta-like [Drosophila arizonae]|uniref:Phosphatidylinositol 4-kinase beta n=1 Tax=Drosophila arizonae TaxID=7263 RepID=A0ABM1NS00_DROAR|nr:PREDICTED: phosphatidylinositol 4-kinase beta-like [Drosophila arizonae]
MDKNTNTSNASMLRLDNDSIKSTMALSRKDSSSEHISTALKHSLMDCTRNEDPKSQLLFVSSNILPPNTASRPSTGSLASTPKNSGFSRSRLHNGFHQSMPSVHGRSHQNLVLPSAELAENQTINRSPKRVPKHQRNFSLDSRSMGILQSPVSSSVSSTRVNQTQHHRNRSLDSFLQRIPEVESSSPNAECEITFSSIATKFDSKICPKMEAAKANGAAAIAISPPNAAQVIGGVSSAPIETDRHSQRAAGIMVESGTTESNNSTTGPQETIYVCSSTGKNKKREDLTSLGSDDSGILCGSESDQLSLNRISHSHESLDLGAMDVNAKADGDVEAEQTTTPIDADRNRIESDLCFLSSTKVDEIDCRTLQPMPESQPIKADDRTRYRVMNMSQAAINLELGTAPNEIEPVMDVNDEDVIPTLPTSQTVSNNIPPIVTPSKTVAAHTPCESSKSEQVLFKSFFGATKNAIFRTAQSIIENHEKKNAIKQKTSEPLESSSTICTPSSSGGQMSSDLVKSPTEVSKRKEFFSLLSSSSSKKAAAAAVNPTPIELTTEVAKTNISSKGVQMKKPALTDPQAAAQNEKTASSSKSSLQQVKVPVPGVVKYINDQPPAAAAPQQSYERGPSGLLRFFESPVFNIHFAVHYLFYSKEPGVLSFIGNKIFSFSDQEVDLYIPQLIVMYIEMDELAEVLDPYLTIRCRKSVDFSLKCLWLLEAYNHQVDSLGSCNKGRKSKLSLMKEIFIKESKPQVKPQQSPSVSLVKKTHYRSQSDATVLLVDSNNPHSINMAHRISTAPAKLCLGDLSSGRAFDNGCTCFQTVRGQVNGLLGHRTFCNCGAPKTSPQKEFMKALINAGKNLTSLSSKAEKTSALRMFLNLINKNLPARVWLPLYSDIPHHVVRITEEKTAVLNSKDKTPYIIYVEVVEVDDIHTSPLIPKMMPSLRHTKSEEHLEGVCLNSQHHCNSDSHQGSSCRRKKGTESSSSNTDSGCGEPAAHSCCCSGNPSNQLSLGGLQLNSDDAWSQEDDDITAQYLNMRKISERDSISQMSLDSCDSRDQGPPVVFNIGDVRTRHCKNLSCENTKPFSNDPEDPSAAALKEPWHEKEKLIRESSPYGHLSNWRLLSAIVKCGDDLRQELMATQLLQMFKIIWLEENVDLWVRPYKIICLSNDSGLIEPILNTVSLHQIKKNSNKSLRDYFIGEYGAATGERFCQAQKNFVQSCAAYCLISYLLQVKDRHNGNILLHSDGHIIHIDFGFILSISPKNLGFEQSPFKLTHEFVDVMGGTDSEHWREFNRLLLVGMMSVRKHMDRIINLVEIMRSNAHLPCFKNGCSGTVQNLRKRFHMNLTEQEMERKVEQLVQDSLKSLSTKLYDGYQYYTNGIL